MKIEAYWIVFLINQTVAQTHSDYFLEHHRMDLECPQNSLNDENNIISGKYQW